MAVGTTTAAILGGGALLGGIAQGIGNRSARNAQQEAGQAALQQANVIRDQNNRIIEGRGGLSEQAILEGNAGAAGFINQGAQQSLNALNGGFGGQRDQLRRGFNTQDQILGGLSGQFLPQDVQSAASLGPRQDRLGALLDGGLYNNFEADPGFQFRLQQSEDAINRSAAARGGRLGGNTLAALQQNASGLASQEFGNFAARQNALAGLAGSSDATANNFAAQNASNQLQLAGIGANIESDRARNQALLGQLLGGNVLNQGNAQAGVFQGRAGQLANLSSGQGAQLANLNSQIAGMQTGANNQFAAQIPGLSTMGAGSGVADAANAFNSTLNSGLQIAALSGAFSPSAPAGVPGNTGITGGLTIPFRSP